ncbi:MAG TPA: hypothetical protein VFB96_25410, partial [Pirellulaceae bacterium]|nr:hypothetical protein [Pirellulaceae bacterium]
QVEALEPTTVVRLNLRQLSEHHYDYRPFVHYHQPFDVFGHCLGSGKIFRRAGNNCIQLRI